MSSAKRWVFDGIGVIIVGIILHLIELKIDYDYWLTPEVRHVEPFIGPIEPSNVEGRNIRHNPPPEIPICSIKAIETKIHDIEKFGDISLSYSTPIFRMDRFKSLEWWIRFERKDDPKTEYTMREIPTMCEAIDRMHKRVLSYGYDELKDE